MSSRTDYGKGDRARSVDRKKWDAGWDRVFGKIAVNIPVVKVMFLIRVKNAVIREINNV